MAQDASDSRPRPLSPSQGISTDPVAHSLFSRVRDPQAWLAAIVESSDDAIVGKTLDSVIHSWNAAAARLFGYEPDEIIGQSVLRLFPPELQHEEAEIIGRLSRGERVEHYETTRVRRDGSRVDVSLSVSPIRDGTGATVGAAKIARDITERRRVEARLREQADPPRSRPGRHRRPRRRGRHHVLECGGGADVRMVACGGRGAPGS